MGVGTGAEGYQEMTMECKSGILKYLCESQFDDNLKFKLAVNEEVPARMRLQPIGRDHQGHLYWLQLDQEHNIRLYTEEQDDPHGATWRCIVRSRTDLVDALKLLKAQTHSNLPQQEPQQSPSFEERSCSDMKQSDGKCPVSLKEEPDKPEVQQDGPKVDEAVERSDDKPPLDNHVRTITAVREESRALLQNTVSVLRAPAGSVRSSQQATIPLKKRELKLSQDYHSNHRINSSIIVLNPSVIHTPGPELTNGTPPPLLPHRSGPDRVPGPAFGHVGVIRHLRECIQSPQPSPECPREQRPARRETVLVHQTEARAVASTFSSVPNLRTSGTLKEEEASSELQREGIRLKIKIPPQRRDKLRGRSAKPQQQQEEEEEEGEAGDEPRLRRSARICRPSSKAAESQRKRVGRSKGPLHLPVTAVQTRKRRGCPKWTPVRSKRPKVKQELEDLEKHMEHTEHPEGEGETQLSASDACTQCGQATHPELILLCDLCDRGYHTACLRPPLMLVPDGDWFCPPCQHKQLCERLEEQLSCLDSALKRQELAEKRRERLVYVGISVENILPEGDKEKSPKKKDVRRSHLGRRSTRARKHISYRFDDFDDAINEAIEDNRELRGSGSDEGIDIKHPITEHATKRTETQRPIRWPAGRVRRKQKRRLNDLESDSTAADSEEEYLLSHSSEEEEELVGWGAGDEADSELCSGDSLSGDRTRRRGPRPGVGRPRRRTRPEDIPELMDWDVSSLSDSGEESSRRALRRGLTQQVNYCESSSSDSGHTPALKTQKRRQERVSSDYSEVSAFSRDSDEECAKEEHGRRKRTRTRHRVRVKQRPRPNPPRQTDTSPPSSEDERPLRRRPICLDSDEEGQRRPHSRQHLRAQS
uniref:PHD-type domain-containing protein n=1 Tax=Neogobius melanostomus TaxID=47308 RepID=A0A8C6S3A1_9GOBI